MDNFNRKRFFSLMQNSIGSALSFSTGLELCCFDLDDAYKIIHEYSVDRVTNNLPDNHNKQKVYLRIEKHKNWSEAFIQYLEDEGSSPIS